MERFRDQVSSPVMIRKTVSSPYLRIFVRIFGSKPLNRWRSRLEPRRARAPVVRRSARKRTPGGPKPSRTLSFPPHNALPRFHSSSASPLSTDSAAKRLSFAEVYHGEATALSRGEPLPSGRVARPLQLKPGGLPRTEGARSTPLRSVSVGRGNRRAHPQNRWR